MSSPVFSGWVDPKKARADQYSRRHSGSPRKARYGQLPTATLAIRHRHCLPAPWQRRFRPLRNRSAGRWLRSLFGIGPAHRRPVLSASRHNRCARPRPGCPKVETPCGILAGIDPEPGLRDRARARASGRRFRSSAASGPSWSTGRTGRGHIAGGAQAGSRARAETPPNPASVWRRGVKSANLSLMPARHYCPADASQSPLLRSVL